VGGKITAEIGYADSIKVGAAEASGVVVAITRDDVDNPFGNRIDGLLGMTFLSRFQVTFSPDALELRAVRLR
jgi:hypothetical protein